ncbi:ribosome biogenesis GTPase Der [Patescibacteria group bacterium]|nr:ribosome biogenesis GTPase Der [Patescibacteria group bacterium]
MSRPVRPQVLLIGRTNVGKSTLLNRLSSQGQSLVSAEKDTTRDNNLGLANWRDKSFFIADSAGCSANFIKQTKDSPTHKLIKEVDVVVMVIDGQTGLSDLEINLAKWLYRLKKPVILAINKIDGQAWRNQAANIHLGFKEKIMVSAKTGVGLGDLLDLIYKHLKESHLPKASYCFTLIGKTNVGKSSLFNKLLRQERSLVLETPHTTRDRQTDWFNWQGKLLELRDTAGVRRQLQAAPHLEKQSVKQTKHSFTDSDGLLLVLDGNEPATWQDQRLAGEIKNSGLPIVVLLNKSDLIKDQEDRKLVSKNLSHYFPFISFSPLLWVSAHSHQGLKNVIPTLLQVRQNAERQLTETELKKFFAFLKKTEPTRNLTLKSFTQTSTVPPRFVLAVKTRERLPQALGNWVESKLRRLFDFTGTPIKVRLQGVRQTNT